MPPTKYAAALWVDHSKFSGRITRQDSWPSFLQRGCFAAAVQINATTIPEAQIELKRAHSWSVPGLDGYVTISQVILNKMFLKILL